MILFKLRKHFIYGMLAACTIPTMGQASEFEIQRKDITLQDFINLVESQSDFTFMLDNTLSQNLRVNVDAKKDNVNTLLAKTFKGKGVNYEIVGNQIILKKVPETTSSTQAKTIKGIVTDHLGEPIIGANIIVKGTTQGTSTDIDGNFEISVSSGNTLVVSYIGYTTREVAIANESNLKIVLADDTKALDEVVVVGFGTEKKVNVIGSIAQIGSEQLENRSTPMLSNALTGQMSGVTVIQRSGQPGQSGGEIRVRGVGSFGATPSALVLIDGIPGSMNDINPEDVESVSVLKDASTAAIYGARAANGVILITTKSGKEGKVSISYNGYVGVNVATEKPQFVDSWEYATLWNEAVGREVYSKEEIQKFRNGSDPDNYANEDYLADVLSKNGLQTNHDLMLNGGNKANQYMISFGYMYQDGLVEKNNYQRYNARVNMTNELHKTLKITTRLSGMHAQTNSPSTPGGVDIEDVTGIIQKAVRFPGLYPTVLSDGTWGAGQKLQGTPSAWVKSSSFIEKPTFKVNANVKLEYTPINNLVLSALGGYEYTNGEIRNYRSTFKLANDITVGPSSLNHSMNKTIYKTFQAFADYSKSFNKNNFSALIGYSWEDETFRNVSASRDKFPGNDLPYLDAGSPDNQKASGSGNSWAIQSVFSRLRYNYDEKYLLESTLRYDGSSRFPDNQKYGFFPSIATGWRISEENFIRENAQLEWINNLKLKASWGRLGNQNIGNYPYQSVYVLGQNYPFGEYFAQGAAITTATDPNIKWEETETIDAGIESIFWNGLLTFNATYFSRKTYDILYKPSSSVSSILGLAVSEMNTGKLRNSGWEFEFGHRNNIGKLNYNISGNFSIINNEVISLGVGNVTQLNGMVGNGSNLFIGHPMQMYYGYMTDGVFIDQADIDSWYDQSKVTPKPKPGDIRYKDISGPDGVPDGKIDPNYDRVPLGSRIPKYTYGINFGCDYKGFDIQVQLQGVAGVKGMLDSYAGWAFWSEGNIQRWQADGRFDPNNPQRYVDYPRLEDLGNNVGPNTQTSDFWILNASYLRVKSAQLGYTLPKRWIQKVGASSLRIFATAENPISWNKYREGWDPEINSSGVFYPILATYTFGVNLKF